MLLQFIHPKSIITEHTELRTLNGTEGTFRPDRIRPIAARFNLDADAVLENVSFLLIPSQQQYRTIHDIIHKLSLKSHLLILQIRVQS